MDETVEWLGMTGVDEMSVIVVGAAEGSEAHAVPTTARHAQAIPRQQEMTMTSMVRPRLDGCEGPKSSCFSAVRQQSHADRLLRPARHGRCQTSPISAWGSIRSVRRSHHENRTDCPILPQKSSMPNEPHHGRFTRRAASRSEANPQATGSS